MRVLVTGGTGFIGSHSVAAMVRAGHRVRLLVRDPTRIGPALRPLAVDEAAIEHVVGQVTDRSTVDRAMAGCDAALHAAAVYSFDTRDHGRMRATNVAGTRVVLAAARAAGVDPIVYVSSFVALVPTRAHVVTADSPPGVPRETYMASKAAADAVARRYQAEGTPVVISYPLTTLGPHDPYLGDQVSRVRNALRGLMPLWPTGGFPIGDVRDVARMHEALLRPGQGPRRIVAPGRYVSTRELLQALRRVTGRRLPAIRLPARALLPVGALAGLVQRAVPAHLPVEYGAIYACAHSRPVDTEPAEALLGTGSRPLDQTLADTVRWLCRAGLLRPRLAGRLADEARREA
jgi:dihydroflavonol-4-reductase